MIRVVPGDVYSITLLTSQHVAMYDLQQWLLVPLSACIISIPTQGQQQLIIGCDMAPQKQSRPVSAVYRGHVFVWGGRSLVAALCCAKWCIRSRQLAVGGHLLVPKLLRLALHCCQAVVMSKLADLLQSYCMRKAQLAVEAAGRHCNTRQHWKPQKYS